MPREYLVQLRYQNDEEILDTGIYYYNFGSGINVFPDDLVDLSGQIATGLSDAFDETMGDEFQVWAVDVSTRWNGTAGPARYINRVNFNVGLGSFGPSIMDSVLVNIQLRGENAEEEPVTGGMRLSGIPASVVEGNNLSNNWASELETTLNVLFPQNISVNGVNFTRAIRHKKTGQEEEFVHATSLTVQRRVGSRLDRVGNRRPQKRSGVVAP